MGGSFTDIEKDVDAASTTACQCPPRSATRLSLAQPEASLVMVLEFFSDAVTVVTRKQTTRSLLAVHLFDDITVSSRSTEIRPILYVATLLLVQERC